MDGQLDIIGFLIIIDGFRKVAQPDQGALLALKQGSVEFWHTNFRQGHHELLHLVQRRVS